MDNLLSNTTQLSLLQATEIKDLKSVTIKDKQDMDEIAREFEAVFLSEMMKPMFEGIEIKDSMFGGGKGEEIFQGMMITEYGKELAKKDVTGIQTQVKNKLIELQAARTEQKLSPALQAGVIKDLDITE